MTDVIDLRHADAGCGGKAAGLGALLRAGFEVPPGFVVPHESVVRLSVEELSALVGPALAKLTGDAPSPYVAVRSSASHEDGTSRSAAGQYDTILAVRSIGQLSDAIRRCHASLSTDRAVAYRGGDGEETMAVIVQRLIDPDVAGVLFAEPGRSTIEACRGLGEPLVRGQLDPDAWTVTDGRIVAGRLGRAGFRIDRYGDRLVTYRLSPAEVERPCLTETQVIELHALGQRLSAAAGQPVDVEWALADGRWWVLQSRPVTAPLPQFSPSPPDSASAGASPQPTAASTAVQSAQWATSMTEPTTAELAAADGDQAGTELGPKPDSPRPPAAVGQVLRGVAAGVGRAAGVARVVRRPSDFSSVRPGDVLVCRETDPAWTPLFSVAGAVVTQTGGVLSHAAIVAREVGIPAVVGLADATDLLAGAPTVQVDGDLGEVTVVAAS